MGNLVGTDNLQAIKHSHHPGATQPSNLEVPDSQEVIPDSSLEVIPDSSLEAIPDSSLEATQVKRTSRKSAHTIFTTSIGQQAPPQGQGKNP